MLVFSVALLLQQPTPPPQRAVPDPGVMAVGQRVTPAGVQSVFEGRVAGVRFGSAPSEVWAAVPGGAWRLAWRDNRVVSRAEYAGRPGVHGLIIDPVTKRPVIASISKLPADVAASRTPGGPPLARAKSVAQLITYANDSTATIIAQSGALGDFLAGAPAIASQPGSDGHRIAVLPLPADDRLAILDADNGTLLRTVALGVLPIASVISADGATAWVSVFGGPKPTRGQRRGTQCCDPAAEPVRIDARGIALPGTVDRIDVASGTVTHRITVGAHPTGLAWNQSQQRLYVANGNSDAISVIDTRTNTLAGTITIAPFREQNIGLTPTALALTPDGNTLVATLGGVNAVALFDVRGNASSATLRGLVPTGWYPSSVDVSSDGLTLAVGTLFGVGAGTGRTAGKDGRYVFAERGTLHVIAMPTSAELSAYTTSVAENNRLHLASGPTAPSVAPRATAVAQAVPERPGEPSLIQHVVYIIKETSAKAQVIRRSRCMVVISRQTHMHSVSSLCCWTTSSRRAGIRPTDTTGSRRELKRRIQCGRCIQAAAIPVKGTIRSRIRRVDFCGRRRRQRASAQ
jgi:YVTN family beta-propeller protein